MSITSTLSPAVYDCILPRPAVRTVEWAEEHVTTPPGSEIKGRIRFDLFPYLREVLDCCDSHDYDRVTLQAASRTGKTTAGQCLLAATAATNPHPMCLTDADQQSVQRVTNRTWKLFEGTRGLADKLPPRERQSSTHMRLTNCEIYAGWSGSPSMAADFAAYLIVKNEVDKWSRRKSDEADFVYLIDERAKGFVNATILEISTPTVAGESYIEQQRLKGDNRRYLVPCPHCGHYQTLRSGDGRESGGLRWRKGQDGHSNPQLAYETAWYECEKCEKAIRDEHRYPMINAGQWIREGEKLDKSGRVRGKPVRAGRHASFGPLSTLYSLLPTITWGRIAQEYVESKQDRSGRRWRNYLNSWEGVTWDPQPVRIEPSQVVQRMGSDDPLRQCPEWAKFLTLSVDVGRVGEDLLFYWWVSAWGLHQRGALIDFGLDQGEQSILQRYRTASYPHADGGAPLTCARGGIDCSEGHVSNRIYDLCRDVPGLWPVKGSSTSGFPDVYQTGFQRTDMTPKMVKRMRKAGRGDLLIANTQRTQEWIEDLTSGVVSPEDANWFSIPVEAFNQDPDLAQQLLNEYPVDERTERGHIVCSWKKKGDNEHRDLARYAWVLAWHYTQHGRVWGSLVRAGEKRTSKPRKDTSQTQKQAAPLRLGPPNRPKLV